MQGSGRARVVSIMLEAVTSCELTHTTHPLLLALAASCPIVGFSLSSSRDGSPLVGGVIVAIVLALLYLGSRRQVLRVSSPSSHIDVLLAGMSLEKATEIIESIERVKNARFLRRPVVVQAA